MSDNHQHHNNNTKKFVSTRPKTAPTRRGSGRFPLPVLPEYIFTERLGSGTYATVYKAYKKVSSSEEQQQQQLQQHQCQLPQVSPRLLYDDNTCVK